MMKKSVYLGIAALMAGAAFAGVSEDAPCLPTGAAYGPLEYPRDGIGSVIQSWATPAGGEARACCETGGYVIVNTYYNPQYVCTPAGSLVGSHNISGNGWRDSSRCHLGSRYYAIINANTREIAFVNHATGSVASWFGTRSMTPFPMNLAYNANARCYYANGYNENAFVYKFTTAGSYVGTVTVSGFGSYCGGLGWTPRAKGLAGSYIWASNFGEPAEAICTPTGSVVARWNGPESNGCGGDSGKHHASTARVVWELRGASLKVYEIDLGNGTAVTPTSLGEVKALYR